MHLQALILAFNLLTTPSAGGVVCSCHSGVPSCPSERSEESHAAWHRVWRTFDIDPLLAEAVVWPELERYSRWQDSMEKVANYGAYVSSGGGPDYSIGLFQMKPSFVEDLEKAWMRSGLARPYELWFDTDDTATARRIRITRLQKEEWQVIYVGVFLRLLYASYGSVNKRGEHTQAGLETLPVEEQVRLAATAYNRGCVWAAPGYGDLGSLRAVAAEKLFHYALIPGKSTRRYCYATLAWEHYRSTCPEGGVLPDSLLQMLNNK